MMIDEIWEELGRLDLTQSELAREMGVSRQEVSRWLRGERVPTQRNLNLMTLAMRRLEQFDGDIDMWEARQYG